MNQVKRNCRSIWLTLFAVLVFMTASALGVSAAEETAETFKLTYLLDGEVFEEQEYQEGDTVAAPEAPKKENFIFTEWKNLPETMPATDQTVTAVYNFDGTLVTDLDHIYECYLEASDEIAVTMYLRINKEGNFVFSRSTDFSSAEKGAGKVYRKAEKSEFTGGTYAVDISWSPMEGMFEPVLELDAENMTFQLYGAADPTVGKGNGTIAYSDGVYTLNFTDGNTTTFTYENDVITFTSKLWYGTASFDQRDEAENFVPYQAELTAAAEQKEDAESGNEENTALTLAPGAYCLVYYVVNEESVALGTHISAFEIQENGNILFTSPFWFGATTPQFVAEDESVTYPEFIISEKEIEKEIEAAAIISKEEQAEANNTEKKDETKGDSTGFKTGTYGGNYTTTAMGSSLTYTCTISFREDGTYTYTVKFNMMGETYTESESGTYQVNGSSITLTSGSGTTMSGTVSGNSVSITRMASSFAFSPVTITFTYGSTPGVTASNANPNQKETEKDNGKESEKETEASKETEKPSNDKTPVTGDGGITGGTYRVDVSWSPMGGMFAPILKIDAEKMTFNLYNASAPDASKGTGTISYKDGIYTLKFENGNTTTFTYKDKALTFTSPLWFGKASFNSAGEDGVFVPYQAELDKEQTTDTPKETEKETEKQPESETEKAPESETGGNETVGWKTGTYTGSYTTTAMGSTVVYTFTMELKEDGTYTHSVKFPMGGTEYTETEAGSYTVENGVITLNAVSGTSLMGRPITAGIVGSGTIQADGTITITRKASSMASSPTAIVYTFGAAGGTTPPSEIPETKPSETPETKPSGTPDTDAGETPGTAALASGVYNVDISWSPMGEMFSPVLEIDAENMTFKVYNKTAPETSKGTGSISLADGVYTLKYDGGNTTSFTYKNGTITFTSPLWYGKVRFNNVGADDTFVPYTAAAAKNETNGSEPKEDEVKFQTGAYGGTYTSTSSSGGNTEYAYTLTFKEDGTYEYQVSFTAMNNACIQNETGTYTADLTKGSLTLTSSTCSVLVGENSMRGSTGQAMTGTINQNGYAASVTRYVSFFAEQSRVMADLSLTYGSAPSLSAFAILETAALNIEESESEVESETEQTTEAVTEAETEQTTETATATETEQATEAVTEAETEQMTEAVTEAETEQTTETATETETEQVTETVTETETEQATEKESETERVTEKVTETETESAVKKETESETETERVTEKLTEPEQNR